jgi:hypothetical protein
MRRLLACQMLRCVHPSNWVPKRLPSSIGPDVTSGLQRWDQTASGSLLRTKRAEQKIPPSRSKRNCHRQSPSLRVVPLPPPPLRYLNTPNSARRYPARHSVSRSTAVELNHWQDRDRRGTASGSLSGHRCCEPKQLHHQCDTKSMPPIPGAPFPAPSPARRQLYSGTYTVEPGNRVHDQVLLAD